MLSAGHARQVEELKIERRKKYLTPGNRGCPQLVVPSGACGAKIIVDSCSGEVLVLELNAPKFQWSWVWEAASVDRSRGGWEEPEYRGGC